jgi:hypothetical protein
MFLNASSLSTRFTRLVISSSFQYCSRLLLLAATKSEPFRIRVEYALKKATNSSPY